MKVEVETRRNYPGNPEAGWTYGLLDRRQREIARRIHAGGSGALLLSELAPVITVGRRTVPGDITLSPELLARQGIELYPTDRGGLATYHGPGQWVLFVVDTLERLTGNPTGVRLAVEGLLEIALKVGREYEPKAEIRGGAEQGVWGSYGKFAAVGIHVAERVVLHGLSLNVFKTPTSFLGLRPCGLDLPVSYLLPAASREASEEGFLTVGKALQEAALKQFWANG